MGIIQKQSIYGLIIAYVGVILGFMTTGYLMPEYLKEDEIGILRVIVSYATLLAQFAGLGFSIVALRMFPYFRDAKTKHHGFMGLHMLISLIGFVLVMSLFKLYEYLFLADDFNESPLLNDFFVYIYPLTIFVLLYNIADSYYKALFDAIKGAYYKDVIQRLIILIVLIIYIIANYDFQNLVQYYVLAFAIPPLMMFFSLYRHGELSLIPEFSFLNPPLKKQITSVALFGMLTSFSGILVINIDVLMIERYLSLSDVGIYAITFFFGSLVKVPARPLTRISGIVISESFKKNEMIEIESIYKKSSINLTTISIWVFLGLIVNGENIIHQIGENYRPGLYVIFFIGLSNVIELSTGVVNQIIFNSKHYKYSSHFILIFTILLIISNLILIPKYGILGAAIATLLANSVFMVSKVVFVSLKLHLFPYSWKTLLPFLFAAIIYFLQTYIQPFDHYIVDLFIRSTIVSILFLIPVFVFNISDDINLWIKKMIRILKK